MIRVPVQPSLFAGRVLVWFSCGITSAAAAKITLEKYPDAEILYCDVLSDEHPDNLRFLRDVERWLGKEIRILSSDKYSGIYDVFEKTGWLYGHGMARCTIELKRAVREKYQQSGDVHIFGFSVEEQNRIARFSRDNPDLFLLFPLVDSGKTKADCLDMIRAAGIELPKMYKLGYKNNNCVGCIKGGKGYWNKIRVDFPEIFEKMSQTERKMCVRRFDVYLDELPETAGRYESELDIECGPVCSIGEATS